MISLDGFDALAAWDRLRVVVVGLGRSGLSAADALLSLGAEVQVVDDGSGAALEQRTQIVEKLGGKVRLGAAASDISLSGVDLLIVSPGLSPKHRLLASAGVQGIPIWGDVELAWRLSGPHKAIPWLGVTGTNGKTTTVTMLEAILRAAGYRVGAFGNIGRPVLEAVLDDTSDYDVLALELSSFELHYAPTLSLHSAAVLNVHDDHLEWYDGSMPAYTADKARIYHAVQKSAVYNVAEPLTEELVAAADVVDGARAIGFTLGTPAVSMLGVVDELLVDRAFIEQRWDSAIELAKVSDIASNAPHDIANALAAAALARSFGVRPQAVAAGLQGVQPLPHRMQTVAQIDEITFVDDSKATNPHSAQAALAAFDSVIWIAGGQAKGTDFTELVQQFANKMRGVALLGIDQDIIADALAQYAPNIPIFSTDAGKDAAMTQLVNWAADLAMPGDVVLLSPGCASLDMYTGYGERGESFEQAALALQKEN